MIDGVIIKRPDKYEDGRGWLAEIWRADESGFRPAMVYLSVTGPGVARGPHEHERQSDYFAFLGPGRFSLHLWDRRKGSRTEGEYATVEAGEDNPCFVVVPPGVVHGYKCVSPTDGWCINMPDKLYKGEGKREKVDEIRWEEKNDSPYKIK